VRALVEVHEVGGGEEESGADSLHAEVLVVQRVIRGS
jgi:hypothetical protein